MIYSYKNIDVNLSKMKVTGVSGIPVATKSQEYFCQSLSLQSSTTLDPNYLLYDKFVESYAARQGINGSLQISYYLTGEDLIRDFFSDDLSDVSGNIGGLNFSKGKVSSYSLNAKPNSPILVNAEISFFNELSGNFKPVFKEAPSVDVFNYYNTSFENLSPEEIGSGAIIFNLNYSFKNEISPVYKIDSGIGEIAPTEINIGKKSSTLKLNTDRITGKMPFSGQNAGVRIGLRNFTGALMDTIHITGIITEKSIYTSENQIISSEITIQQSNTSKNIQSVQGAESSDYGLNTLCRVSGEHLDEVYTLRIGNIFYNFIGPFKNSSDFINRYNGTDETNFTKVVGPDGRTEIIILSPPFHSAGESLYLIGNGAVTIVSNISWKSATPLVSGAIPNPQFIGSTINISGANFYGVNKIFLGNSEIKSFNQVNSNLISDCVIPEDAESGIIKLVSRGSLTGSGAFAFFPYPKITGLNTYTGIVGQKIEILGAAFNHVTGVRFNKTLASNFTVNSNFKITATIPSGDIQGPISVSGYTGTFSTSTFNFQAIPVITGQVPGTGLTGSAVRFLGTGIIPELLYSPNNDNRFLVRFNGVNATGLFSFVSDSQSNFNGSLTGIVPKEARKGNFSIIKNTDLEVYPSTFNFKLSGVSFDLLTISPKTGSSSFLSNGLFLEEITGLTLKNTRTSQEFIIPSGDIVGFKVSVVNQANVDSEPLHSLIVKGLTGTGFVIKNTLTSGKLIEGLYNIILTNSSNVTKEFSQRNVNTFYFATKPELSGFSPLSGVIGDTIKVFGTGLYDGTLVRLNRTGQSSSAAFFSNSNSDYSSSSFTINGSTLKDVFFPESLPPVEFVTGFFTFKNQYSNLSSTGNSSGVVPFKLIGPPYISGFTPTSASLNDTVVVSGLGFINVNSLNLSDTNIKITQFNVVGSTGINFQITDHLLSGSSIGNIIVFATGGSFTSSDTLSLTAPTPVISGFSPQPAVHTEVVVLTGTNLNYARRLDFSGTDGSPKSLFLDTGIALGKFTLHLNEDPVLQGYHLKFLSPFEVINNEFVTMFSTTNGSSISLVRFDNQIGQFFTISGHFLSDNALAGSAGLLDFHVFSGISGDVFGISGSGFSSSSAKVLFGTEESGLLLAPIQAVVNDRLITGKMEGGLNEKIYLSGKKGTLSYVEQLRDSFLFPQILGVSKTVFVEGDAFKITGLNTYSFFGSELVSGNLESGIFNSSRLNTNVRLAITGCRYGSYTPEVEFLNYNISGFELSKGNLNFSGQINAEFAGTGRIFLINSLESLRGIYSTRNSTTSKLTYSGDTIFNGGSTKNHLDPKIISTFNGAVTINEKQAKISGFSPKFGQSESEVTVTGTSLRAVTGVSLFSGSTESTSSIPFYYESFFYDVNKPINFGQIKFTVPTDFTQLSGRLRFRSKNHTTDTDNFFKLMSASSPSISPSGGVAGDVITLNGSIFNSATNVDFVNLDNEIVSGKFTIVNDEQITVIVPVEGRLTAPQIVSIKITNSEGSVNLGDFEVRQGSEKFFGNIQATGFISGLNFLGTGLGGKPTVNGSGVLLVGEVFGNIQATGFISGLNFLGTGLGGRPTVNGTGVLLVGEATAGGGGNITITGGLDTSSASQIFTGDGVKVLFGLNSGIHTGINGSTDQIRATSVLVSLDGLLQDPIQHYTITTHLVGVAYSGLLFASAPVTGTEIEVRRFGDTVTVDFTGGGGGGVSDNQAIIYALVFG